MIAKLKWIPYTISFVTLFAHLQLLGIQFIENLFSKIPGSGFLILLAPIILLLSVVMILFMKPTKTDKVLAFILIAFSILFTIDIFYHLRQEVE